MKNIVRSIGRWLLTSSFVLTAAASVAAPVGAGGTFVTSQHERNGTVYVRVEAPSGGVGWQAYYTYNVTQGKNLIFEYICPSDATTPVNGSFSSNSKARAGLQLVGSYRPSGARDEWGWAFDWPSGAPSGSVLYFNVYCVT